MFEWHTMMEKEPKEGDKFIALYNDGGGSRLYKIESGKLYDEDGNECYLDNLDNYFYWALVPDKFKFWSEIN